MKTIAKRIYQLAAAASATFVLVALLNSLVLADVPSPVLKIASLGSNQFSITITNGMTNVNYELYWQPILKSPNHPWQLLGSGDPGETNWTVEAGVWPSGFFHAAVGNDWDGDSVFNWMDADPNNALIGALTITIDSPTNGFNIE